MAENSVGIQEYFESYIPSLIEKRLAEKPVPDMEGTTFTLQLTIKGEKSLSYGIAIKDAKEITVTPGEIENPMFSIVLTEDFIKPIVDMASSFTGKKQYDAVSQAKGTVDVDMSMPGDWTMPLTMVFNGASQPSMRIAGSSTDFAKMASGELNGPAAFMQGKIKLDGDMAFGLSLANIFM